MSYDKIYDVEVVDEIELGAAEDTLDAAGYRLWHKAVRFGTWTPVEIDTSLDREQYEPEERGAERLMALYERRMRDIFG